jgi:Tol biopolymer transport system component
MFHSLASSCAVVLLLLLSGSASAFHQVTPPLVQITPTSGAGTINDQHWAGIRYVVFDSDADITHVGSTGRQIYLFDLLERDVYGLPGVYRITGGPGDPSHGSTGKLGNLIVYDATPPGGGPRQLFLYDRRTTLRYQLTQGVADSRNARMDESSRMIVFESDADFFASGPAGTQIYRIDLRKITLSCPLPCASSGNEGLVQITRAAGTSKNPVVSSGGKVVAFESDADLIGIGETTNQVYAYNVKRASYVMLGHGPGESRNPTIALNGGWIAFESDSDLLGVGTSGTQIYARKKNHSFPQQVSDGPIGHCSYPTVSANGHAVTFVSTDDLLGNGSTGPEAFSYDLRHRFLRQVSDTQAGVDQTAYAAGVFVTFVSNGDLLGNGTVGSALYLVNLFALGTSTVP